MPSWLAKSMTVSNVSSRPAPPARRRKASRPPPPRARGTLPAHLGRAVGGSQDPARSATCGSGPRSLSGVIRGLCRSQRVFIRVIRGLRKPRKVFMTVIRGLRKPRKVLMTVIRRLCRSRRVFMTVIHGLRKLRRVFMTVIRRLRKLRRVLMSSRPSISRRLSPSRARPRRFSGVSRSLGDPDPDPPPFGVFPESAHPICRRLSPSGPADAGSPAVYWNRGIARVHASRSRSMAAVRLLDASTSASTSRSSSAWSSGGKQEPLSRAARQRVISSVKRRCSASAKKASGFWS